MAYAKIYSRINWENLKSTSLGATNLNKIDYAVGELDNRVVSLDTAKAEQATVLNMVSDFSMDETTGIITITKLNGEQILFDLNIEKIPTSFSMTEEGILTMTTDDGTEFTADIGSMIPVVAFNNSDTIAVTVTGEGADKVYSFNVKDGSITDSKIQPNYLADITVQAQVATNKASEAEESATRAEASAVRAENAAATADVQIATENTVGIVKPDNATIGIEADGTIKVVGEYLTEEDAKGYALKTDLDNYLTEIPDEYVTETDLSNKGYALQSDLDDLSLIVWQANTVLESV